MTDFAFLKTHMVQLWNRNIPKHRNDLTLLEMDMSVKSVEICTLTILKQIFPISTITLDKSTQVYIVISP